MGNAAILSLLVMTYILLLGFESNHQTERMQN